MNNPTKFDGDHLLAQCIRSGQVGASQIHQHQAAGELPITMQPSRDDDMARLQQELADIAAVILIECNARRATAASRGLWDVSSPDEDELPDHKTLQQMADELAKAARYLDLRGLLARPVDGQPQLVRIRVAQ